MIFPTRRRRTKDPHLVWKIRLFFVGAVLALAGLALDLSLLVGGAVVVLMAGVALRFLPAKDEEE